MAILAPNPSHSPFLLQRHAPNQKNPCPLFANSPSNKFKTITHFSSPSPTPLVTQEEDSSVLSPSPPAAVVGCKTCGREEIEKGCNGEGRIQGGIATVPGFGWWPIKAYRPCPGFTASGGRYRRRGQSMDEVASGQKRDVALKSSKGESKSVSSKKKREKK